MFRLLDSTEWTKSCIFVIEPYLDQLRFDKDGAFIGFDD